jgi:hypothetical protein
MITVFDVITVIAFFGLVLAFFFFSSGDTRTLLQFLLSGMVLAIANQVGNAGSVLLGGALIVAGIGYACLSIRR